jgi:hypothetical protein
MRIASASAELLVPLPNQRTRLPDCQDGRRMVMGRSSQRRSVPGGWIFSVLRGSHRTCKRKSAAHKVERQTNGFCQYVPPDVVLHLKLFHDMPHFSTDELHVRQARCKQAGLPRCS